MEKSLLSKLPAELRNIIYKEVLLEADGIDVIFSTFGDRPKVRPSMKHRLAITASSRQLRNETLPIFYGANSFALRTTMLDLNLAPPQRELPGFLSLIGTRAASLVRHIHVVALWRLDARVLRPFVRCIRDLYSRTNANISLRMEVQSGRGTMRLELQKEMMLDVQGLEFFRDWAASLHADMRATVVAKQRRFVEISDWEGQRLRLAHALASKLSELICTVRVKEPELLTLPHGRLAIQEQLSLNPH